MVNELRDLMRDAVASPPHDHGDPAGLVAAGRRRVRVRRTVALAATSLAAGAIALSSVAWLDPSAPDPAAAGVPHADGPTISLSGARPAVVGTDYRELATYTNEDLESDNGEYFDGVTDDGLVLLREGATMTRHRERFALLDPATGEKEWLPDRPGAGQQSWALELGEDRLVLMRLVNDGGMAVRPEVDVLDRTSSTWRSVRWPTLPAQDDFPTVRIGPDGRVWATVLTRPGRVPDGGWPVGPDGEADDADAEGSVGSLWSMSITDPGDVRDEGLQVGDFGFDGDRLVWTDSSNGAAGDVHVRDLSTGEETSFDPRLGARCNLLGLDVAGGRIAMTQYCGTYDGGVRDDRVQVVTTEGEQVVTVQASGVDGGDLVAGGDYLTLTAYDRATGGTYLYDFEDGRLLRLGEGISSWSVATGPTPGDQLLWTTPAGRKVATFGRSGATAHLGEIIR